jgi:hypothetical protein
MAAGVTVAGADPARPRPRKLGSHECRRTENEDFSPVSVMKCGIPAPFFVDGGASKHKRLSLASVGAAYRAMVAHGKVPASQVRDPHITRVTADPDASAHASACRLCVRPAAICVMSWRPGTATGARALTARNTRPVGLLSSPGVPSSRVPHAQMCRPCRQRRSDSVRQASHG